jgi:acyl transferase domain-containing protein
VAVHLACASLQSGEITLGIAGGVNLNLIPDSAAEASRFGALSANARCFTFDERADGYVRGEGGGVVVLKRLSRALADRDRIYCVIRGSAVNNDGLSNGLTAPNPQAQEAVLRDAYRRANVRPRDVHYVEAHGTGTRLGDPIEVGALGAVLSAERGADRALRIGSVKTNIGHLEGAAGIAGLIKTVLSIQHRTLPASLHFVNPNPHIAFERLNIVVQSSTGPWPSDDAPKTAGVSSFGFGGTNAHVVMQELVVSRAELFASSAASAESLREKVQQVALGMRQSCETSLRGVCDAASRESWHGHRLAATASSHHELQSHLDAFLRGAPRPGLATGIVEVAASGPVFVFSGQGKQRPGMGKDLLESEPVFRRAIEERTCIGSCVGR